MTSSRMATIAAMMASLAAAAALSACGGGGGDSPSSPPPPPAPSPDAPVGTAGIYSVDYGQFRGVYTLLADGTFEGVHFISGGALAGHPHGKLSATNSVTARESIAWANFVDDSRMVGAQEPSGVFGRTFTSTAVNVSITGSMGSFTATASQQMGYGDGSGKTLYADPIPLSVAAGIYSGRLRTVGIDLPQQNVSGFTLDATGQFTVTAVGCAFAGTLVQHGATGVYDAQVTTSGPGCQLAATLAGVATPLVYNAGKPQWALQLDSADNQETAVFIIDKD